ncbi:MAG TPA: carbohydrate ABC transporter permease [Chloroflexota bacterium]|nr:carbohydrate ABC transporter permease [Chloroflexota bacterium]
MSATTPAARRLLPGRFPVRAVVTYGGALVAFFYLLGPFAWVIISSFMTKGEATSVPPHWIPYEPTLDNYAVYADPRALEAYREDTRLTVGVVVRDVPMAMRNSVIVAFAVAGINIVLGSVTAYPFARLPFRGRVPLLVVYLVTRMVPGLALVLPIYLLMRQLQLLDSHLGLIAIYLTFTMPYTIWILKNYFQTIPRELEEAAYVDGATWRQAMVRVILPVAVPGLITVGMFSFMASWGEFFYALLLTTTINARTMPVEATFLTGELGTEYGFLMAASVLAVIPPLALALIFQRVIIQGIAAGALKG